MRAKRRAAGTLTEWFKVMKGVRQGCIISPNLFNIYAEIMLRKTLENFDGGIRISGRRIINLRYADAIHVVLLGGITRLG